MESKTLSPESTNRTTFTRNVEQAGPETAQHLAYDSNKERDTVCNTSASAGPSGGCKDSHFHQKIADVFNLLDETEMDYDATASTGACKGNEDESAKMVKFAHADEASVETGLDVGNPLAEHTKVQQENILQHVIGITDDGVTLPSSEECEEDDNDKENVSNPVINHTNVDQQNTSRRGFAPSAAQCSDAGDATIPLSFSGVDEYETTALASSNVESMSTVSDVQKTQSSALEQEFDRSDHGTFAANATTTDVSKPLQTNSTLSLLDIINGDSKPAYDLDDGCSDVLLNQPDLISSLVCMHSEQPSTDSEAATLPEQTDHLAENSSSSLASKSATNPIRDYQSLHSMAGGAKNESVRVLVRVRPPPAGVSTDLCVKVDTEHYNKLTVSHKIKQRSIQAQFDRVLPAQSSQADVYAALQGTVDALLCGINCTVLAYGQTGSGKTHTMLGKDMEGRLSSARQRTAAISAAVGARSDWGVIPRILHDLFTAIERELADGSVAQVCFVFMCYARN